MVSVERLSVMVVWLGKTQRDREPSGWNDLKKREMGQREPNKDMCTTMS